MGVHGLVTFLSRLPNGCRAINLIEEIRKSEKPEPLILLDLLTITHAMSGPINETIYGCRNEFAWANACNFCDSLLEAGARLVFFLDGKVQESKVKSWCQSQNYMYFECLKKIEDATTKYNHYQHVTVNGNVTKHAFTSALIVCARKKGVLITTYDKECDQEIASFATKHDALAVLTADSDLMIYEGKWRIWSTKDIDLESLRTLEWNKEVLREALCLEWNQMPFFAAIAGNDHFKNRPFGMRTFYEVASLVKALKLSLGITQITNALFEKIFNKLDDTMRNSFKEAVQVYDSNYHVNRRLIAPDMIHYPNIALRILCGIPSSIRLPCLDLRDANYTQLALQIYCKQVGMLFQHKTLDFEQQLSPPVFVKPDHFQPYSIVAVAPIFPPAGIDVPKPWELYSLDPTISAPLVWKKLRLLCWLVSEKLRVEDICHIHQNYLLDVITLYLLVENNLTDVMTADILLIAIHDCLRGVIPRSLRLIRPRKPNLVTSFTYVHFYSQIYHCAEVVGLCMENYMLCKFDGVYFNGIVDLLRADFTQIEATLRTLDAFRIYARIPGPSAINNFNA